MGITDDWTAYQIDAAALRVGREVEEGLYQGHNLERLLKDGPLDARTPSSEYANPRMRYPGRRVRKVN